MPRGGKQGSFSRPLVAFLHLEAAGGLILLVTAATAMVIANSPLADAYESFWAHDLGFRLGRIVDLRGVVNDGLMAIFFLVVGLEIRRELVAGELRGSERAALPIIAAVGGMVIPAFIYVLINPVGDAARGWGIPTATDIAFALGVLALLGSRVPPGLKVFILALAITDDIGAIGMIAVFYTEGIDLGWLSVALALGGLTALLRRMTTSWVPYLIAGLLLWVAVSMAGIHPTIVGVAIAFLIPSGRRSDGNSLPERIEDRLHPIATFAVVPLFALANAGVALGGLPMTDRATAGVATGVALGLIAGKLVGIVGASLLAIRFRFAAYPDGVTMRHLIGGAAVAGIGFTVSLFITDLAFASPELEHAAKIGVLVGSLGAAALGSLILLTGRASHESGVG